MQNHKSNDNPWRAAGLVSAVTADLIVCIMLGYWGGSWLSNRLEDPKFIAIGTLVGLFIGIVSVVMMIRFYAKEPK